MHIRIKDGTPTDLETTYIDLLEGKVPTHVQ